MEKFISKFYNIEKQSVNEDEREVIACASKEIQDRDGDIIRIDGIDIKEYKKNPVVLFGHNHSDLPIAKCTKVWKEDKKLMVKIKFPEPEVSSVGDSIYKLIKGDYLSCLSIGFAPKWDKAVQLKDAGWDFKESSLYEISVVPIPANPGAMVEMKSLQKAVDDEVIDELELKELFMDYKEKDIITVDPPFSFSEIETNNTDEKLEQNTEKSIYDWIWKFVDDEEEPKKQELIDEIYDALGLTPEQK